MLQAYMLINLHTRECIIANEVIQKTLDEDMVLRVVSTLEGVAKHSFSDELETSVSDLSLVHGATYYYFRWGRYLAAVILATFETKQYATVLAETVFELETSFGEDLLQAKEELKPAMVEVVLKNFKDLIYEPVEDVGSVTNLLTHKNDYYMHTGRDGARVYEEKKKGAALRNFVHSYDTINFPAVDEVISILLTDVITVANLEKRARSLSTEDLALTLRQLLRLNIIECYTQPRQD
ncbi:MAG: hypothetical protein ACFFD4_16710 [Candidatus Odinarchaeota archaeon]